LLAGALAKDPAWEVRRESARALATSQSVEAIAPLQQARDTDPNEFVRVTAEKALAALPPPPPPPPAPPAPAPKAPAKPAAPAAPPATPPEPPRA
jgi:hypothetical protein